MKKTKYILPIARIITSVGLLVSAIYRQSTGEGNAFIAAVIPSATVTLAGGVQELRKAYNEPENDTPLQEILTTPSTHFQDMVRRGEERNMEL